MTRERKPIVRVDLTGVTFIDGAGKACLATMHRQGAEFIALDCMTKDVVREICEDRSRMQPANRAHRYFLNAIYEPTQELNHG